MDEIPLPTLVSSPLSTERLIQLYMKRECIDSLARYIVTAPTSPDTGAQLRQIHQFIQELQEFMIVEGKEPWAQRINNLFRKYYRYSLKAGAWENFLEGLKEVLIGSGVKEVGRFDSQWMWVQRAHDRAEEEGDQGDGGGGGSLCFLNECINPAPDMRCSQCKQVYYCSKECQVSHWHSDHNRVCSLLKDIDAGFDDPTQKAQIRLILMKLDMNDLAQMCQVNKNVNSICKERSFRMNYIREHIDEFKKLFGERPVEWDWKKIAKWLPEALALKDNSLYDPTDRNNWIVRASSHYGKIEVLKLLLEDERVDPTDRDNYAIRWASENGHPEVVKLLLNWKGPNGKVVNPTAGFNFPVRVASSHNHPEVVKLLLEDKRVDPTVGNDDALNMAVGYGHNEVVRLLIEWYRKHNIPLPPI